MLRRDEEDGGRTLAQPVDEPVVVVQARDGVFELVHLLSQLLPLPERPVVHLVRLRLLLFLHLGRGVLQGRCARWGGGVSRLAEGARARAERAGRGGGRPRQGGTHEAEVEALARVLLLLDRHVSLVVLVVLVFLVEPVVVLEVVLVVHGDVLLVLAVMLRPQRGQHAPAERERVDV